MKTINLSTPAENRKKVVFINFTNTKRLQWNRFRRFGLNAFNT